jgi:hypothetical protein
MIFTLPKDFETFLNSIAAMAIPPDAQIAGTVMKY